MVFPIRKNKPAENEHSCTVNIIEGNMINHNKGETMSNTTRQLISALRQTNEAGEAMLNLLENGIMQIGDIEQIPMLSLALGALYSAYTTEVMPILKQPSLSSMN